MRQAPLRLAIASSNLGRLPGCSGQPKQVRDTVSGMNPLPIHLHRHVYWIVPLLVIGVVLLVYWALNSGGGESRGPQL